MGFCCSKEEESDDAPYSSQDSTGRISLNDFRFEKVVGRGAFGKVMMVRKKDTGQVFAMKVLKKEMLQTRNQKIHTKTERDVLAKVKSPFIVQLFYAFQSPEKLYFVMEFLNGGELFFHLRKEKRFTENRTAFYAAEILLAIECLHAHDIIYRDLKPENILMDAEGHVKISDFGLSKDGLGTSKKKAYTVVGTPDYLAPEILKGVGHDKAVDWWSFGVLIYEMLCGVPPFYHRDRSQVLKNIVEKPVEMKSYFSDKAKSLLTGLLCRNPAKRIGTERDGEEVKQQPFFDHIDWAALAEKKVQPTFKPNVSSSDDFKNFDKEFTGESITDTPGTKLSTNKKKELAMEGFTYQPEGLGDAKAGKVEGK